MNDTVAEAAPEVATEVATEQSAADVVAEAVSSDRPDFLLDKYATDGRSIDDAIKEQAKGYSEIRKKMGAFTGAPDAYEPNISPELTEAGFELLENDPLVEQFSEAFKEMGINQEGFDRLLDIYATQQLAEIEAGKAAEPERVKEEMAKLGANADQRIKNVQDWVGANMSEEHRAGLEDMATSAAAVGAIEALIAKSRNAPQATATAAAPEGMTKDDALAMRYVKHENGQLLMAVDPAYRRKADQALEDVMSRG